LSSDKKCLRLKSPSDFAGDPALSPADLKAIEVVSRRYAVAVTPHVMSTIKGPAATDPVARQYIPSLEELKILPEENPDPIGDDAHSPVKGIVHRYADRVLLKPVHACAVYCRFCFRREMVGPGGDALNAAELAAAISYIEAHPEIREVIITGGDPLIMAPRQLAAMLNALEVIPHIEMLRIHTRVPAADPSRITPELCAALEREKPLYVAVHINHAQEFTGDVKRALKDLHRAGCLLLGQSVLLRGVNDTVDALEDLFRSMAAHRIKPYYLHHGDLAPGTSHFRTTIAEGQALMRALQGRLSGLCLPQYMLDIPGGHGKVPVGPTYLHEDVKGVYMVRDRKGKTHIYPPPPKDQMT
jgi:lysine 2,3-aminomutase